MIVPAIMFLSDQALGYLGYPSEVPVPYSHPPNLREYRKYVEFEYEFRTNDHGLRYRNISETKNRGEHRIFVVGDSYTEGVVNSADTFTAKLEQQFNSKPESEILFINGGLGGTGPLHYWRIFLNVGLKYNLDGVLICIFANDLANMPLPLSREDLYAQHWPGRQSEIKWMVHDIFPRFYTVASKVYYSYRSRRQARDLVSFVSGEARRIGIDEKRIRAWADALPRELVEATNRGEFNGRHFSLGLLDPEYWTDSLDINSSVAERKWQALELVLEEFVLECRNQDLLLGLVYLPSPFQYDAERFEASKPMVLAGVKVKREWLKGSSNLQKRIAIWAQSRSVAYFDLTSAFREKIKEPQPLTWRLDDHWNVNGNDVASQVIATWLEDDNVFPFLQ